jgi:MoaA/NifB/PqqE/SkfB family radical SAM enzyme
MIPKLCLYYITLRCNATCEFCQSWQGQQKTAEADLSEIQDKLREIKRTGVETLEITGGEPLLVEHLPQALKTAKDLKLKTVLTTNCILYPERYRELKGLIDTLYFSLDYPEAGEHDRSRGIDCFNTVLRSVNYAKEIGGQPILYFTLTRDSVRFLPEMVELAEKLKVRVFLNPVYDFQGLQGFERATYAHIKYYAKRPHVMVSLAALDFLAAGGNNLVWPRCRAQECVLTLLPDLKVAAPCFFNQGGRQGREAVCSGCTRWPYMLPSFSIGLDKYRFLDWYSNRR